MYKVSYREVIMWARVQIELRGLKLRLNVTLSIDMRVCVSRFKAQHIR